MNTDVQGCSTCPKGEERYETYYTRLRTKKVKRVQYDYRHTNGELFSCVKPTLLACRKERDEWLKKFNTKDNKRKKNER